MRHPVVSCWMFALLLCAAAAAPARAQQTAPPTFTRAEFKKLSWLDGRWRGSAAAGSAFYEEYRIVNDSTIAMRSFADSTFARATEGRTITLRASRITSQGGSRVWAVERIDTAGFHFAPVEPAPNRFTWKRLSNDAWLATLVGASGQQVVYRLERVAR